MEYVLKNTLKNIIIYTFALINGDKSLFIIRY